MILKLQGTSEGFSLKELHDCFQRMTFAPSHLDKYRCHSRGNWALWFGILGPWPRLVSPPEQSQRCPGGGAGRSQLALANQLFGWQLKSALRGEFTQWGPT